MQKNKKAVSALISIVMIVLITLAAVGIVWQIVIPLIKTSMEASKACGEIRLFVEREAGYTCYNADKREVQVQVSRGPDEVELVGLQLKVAGAGESKTVNVKEGWQEIPDLKRSKVKILVIDEQPGYSKWRDKLAALGYNTILNTTVTTVEQVDEYAPDIVASLRYVWGCTKASLFNKLYNEGFAIFTEGNDNTVAIMPISSATWTNATAGTISADKKTNHPITEGWDTTPGSGSDSRFGITAIHPNAYSIARDDSNNFFEAIYLEEQGKGSWYHHQPSALAHDQLLINAINYLARIRVYEYGKKDFITLPGPNEESTYVMNAASLVLTAVDSVAVAPIVKIGEKEYVCEMTLSVRLPECG